MGIMTASPEWITRPSPSCPGGRAGGGTEGMSRTLFKGTEAAALIYEHAIGRNPERFGTISRYHRRDFAVNAGLFLLPDAT